MLKKTTIRIGFLGHYGNQNLGDEATLQALLQQVRRYYPNSEIIIISPNPEDTRQRYNTRVFPMHKGVDSRPVHSPLRSVQVQKQRQSPERHWLALLKQNFIAQSVIKPLMHGFLALPNLLHELVFTLKCLRLCQQMHLLIISGGGQVDDTWNGVWGSPFTLLRWSLAIKACGKKLYYLCLGAGPIQAQSSRRFFKTAFNLADFHSFRDLKSQALIRSIGVREPNPVFPDMAYGLEVAPKVPSGRKKPLVVGFSPMAFLDARSWPESDDHFYRNYVEKLAHLAAWLLERDYHLFVFATQLKMDPPVIVDLRLVLRQKSVRLDRFCYHPVARVDEVMQVIAETDFVITSRLHGVILSHLLARPVIALSYHPKIDSVLAAVNQSHLCLNITDFDLASLVDRIGYVESHYEMLQNQIRTQVQLNKQALQQQYEQLFQCQFVPTPTVDSGLASGNLILEQK